MLPVKYLSRQLAFHLQLPPSLSGVACTANTCHAHQVTLQTSTADLPSGLPAAEVVWNVVGSLGALKLIYLKNRIF